ncbi:39S ribosomal protein L17, mitochondrial isoform X2 [Choloepus didactylus]|uniref:39S ribosomal protein L17, mitochondrial isoform X2 n=1 Tax=Choloepus didactylus TaxID=27675 RepID=UPI0018A06B2F|nr:39S ribosomal protein L17, mitochondrial isoform X2 [Choloepus didactylus]
MRLSVAAAISHGRVFRRLGLGPESRIHLLRNLLTGLVRHERIEAPWARLDEMRGYAEKEKDLIPKLFQVLAPRYQSQNGGYTRMLQIPNGSRRDRSKMAVIEYKGNCLPPLPLPRRDSNLTLLNQLLQGLWQDLSQDQETSIHSPPTAQTPEV